MEDIDGVTKFEYDALGRLVAETSPGGENQEKILDALKLGDWPKFVKLYNGNDVGTLKNDRYVQDIKSAMKTYNDAK